MERFGQILAQKGPYFLATLLGGLETTLIVAAGALVFFHPIETAEGELIKPLGYVQEDGTFALTTYTKDDGAPQGEYSVTIEWRQPKSSPFGARNPGPDKLQGRYGDPGRSKIRFQVDPKPENTVPPIRLE